MSFPRLAVGNTQMGVRQLPAPQKAVPQFIAPTPTRQLDAKSLYNGLNQSVDMNVTLGAHKSEMDVNPSPDFKMVYESFFSDGLAVDYHPGEVILKVTNLVTEARDSKKDGPVKVVGLSELITLFAKKSKTPRVAFHPNNLAFEFLGVYLNNRTVEAGLPQMHKSRTSLASMSIEGMNNVMPYWGKNVRQQGRMYLFILQLRPAVAHIGEYRVYPFVYNGDNIDDARAAFVEDLMTVAVHAAFINDALALHGLAGGATEEEKNARRAPVYAEQIVYAVSIGRIRANRMDRVANTINLTADVPGYNLDFLRKPTSAPIPVTIDNMKMEYTRLGNAYYKCPMYTRLHMPYQRRLGNGRTLVLTPRPPPGGGFMPAAPHNTLMQRDPRNFTFARRGPGLASDESSGEEEADYALDFGERMEGEEEVLHGSDEDESEIGFNLREDVAHAAPKQDENESEHNPSELDEEPEEGDEAFEIVEKGSVHRGRMDTGEDVSFTEDIGEGEEAAEEVEEAEEAEEEEEDTGYDVPPNDAAAEMDMTTGQWDVPPPSNTRSRRWRRS